MVVEKTLMSKRRTQYLGRDHETKNRKYHNRTVHGPMREAQAYDEEVART